MKKYVAVYFFYNYKALRERTPALGVVSVYSFQKKLPMQTYLRSTVLGPILLASDRLLLVVQGLRRPRRPRWNCGLNRTQEIHRVCLLI